MKLQRLVWLAPLVLLAACSRPAPLPEPVRAVRTITVGAEAAGSTVEFAAEVRARTESRLGFRVGGKLVKRNADVGDSVRKGQVLASLDPQDLRLAQDASSAALQAARVNAEQAASDLKRARELRAQGFISDAELDRRDNAAKAAQAQWDQAKAQASVQGNQARYGDLVADVSGVVTAVDAEPGAVLAAGAAVLRLAHDGPRDVVFAVPEQDVSALRALTGKAGAVKVRLWGGTALLPATVREVAAAADPATRTFAIKADIGRADVRLGQTATVMLAVPAMPGALRLPLAAVFEHQAQSSVWVLDRESMTVRARPVQVAGAEGSMVLVASGLRAGEQVVSAGVHTLTPGQKVSLYGAAAPGAPASGVR
jgi:membrane fusion protein, multidrug efflux system